ncbi:RHS repeat-associated core domain-containing protein, partial [Spirochaeta dissipatitropha]
STVENPFGNIIYTYNTANRLTQAGQRHYDYDVNGNLLKEYTDKELISYSYTPDNRVAEYQRVDLRLSKNGSEDPEIIQNYRYDGLGRRVSLSARNTRDTRNALPETRYEFYEYEGMGFSFARLQFSSVSTGNDLQKAPSDPGGTRYRPAPGSEHNGGTLFGDSYRIIHAQGRAASRISAQTGSLPGSQAAPGSNIIYSHDRLGSVVRESSMTGFGMASREYSYDAFGASIGTHSPEFFGYTGKPYDPITGMYDYGFRDYAPMQARFTTVDPIRDGTNWYAYVGNDPVNFVDPLGLEAVRSSDAATGGHAIPDSPEPTLWTQDRAKEEFGASFASKACAVTSIANAVSTQYTDTKQKALEDNAYNSMVGQSISDGHVNKTNAYIDSWSGAANSMAKAIGLDDDGSFTYNPDNDADHVIHAEDRSGLGYPGHFLLDQGDGTAHDPLSGTNRNIDEDFTAAQKGLGPTRGLDWKPKK